MESRLKPPRTGAVLIETVIVLPILLMMTAWIISFGILLTQSNDALKASAYGARMASITDQAGCYNGTVCNASTPAAEQVRSVLQQELGEKYIAEDWEVTAQPVFITEGDRQFSALRVNVARVASEIGTEGDAFTFEGAGKGVAPSGESTFIFQLATGVVPTSTVTSTPSSGPTVTLTPTHSPTLTPGGPTVTITATSTPTATASVTATVTATATATSTSTSTPTTAASPTLTPTRTPTATNTPIPTLIPTFIPTSI